ncbi:MFS transporter [Fretibacter rubidus]|uniref:MFS transporter n=1 Tax=Fretibacter rubidus TaxID=570162 RepID=UPI00352B5FFC
MALSQNSTSQDDTNEHKPYLNPWRILEMNLGFLGLQFSFGLQQGQVTPIYKYLGAEDASIPLLALAGPLTGLIVQPIVGALSDKTLSRWGRRTPYFVLGAIMCSVGLFFMPLSMSLMMAVSCLWIMDAGNNMTMEPYRAYISDRLRPEQRQFGFLTQSAFTGLAQMLAFLAPSIMVYVFGISINDVDANNIPKFAKYAFFIGAFLSITTVLWSISRVPELPLTEEEIQSIKGKPKGFIGTFGEIWHAIIEMPVAMRKLALMSLFQWYGISCYWGYVVLSIGRSVFGTADSSSEGFRVATLANGEMAAFYNGLGFFAAFAMIPLAKRFGANRLHALCLVLGGIGMLIIPNITERWMLFLPAIGVGIAWASIMGNPYVILANSIPADRTGVYMGIFNMMIVIPMLIVAATLPFFYNSLLGGDPGNVLRMSGVLLFLAAISVWWVKTDTSNQPPTPANI